MGKRRITRESMIINFGTNYYVAGAFLSSCKESVHIHVFIDVGTEVQRGEMYDLTKIKQGLSAKVGFQQRLLLRVGFLHFNRYGHGHREHLKGIVWPMHPLPSPTPSLYFAGTEDVCSQAPLPLTQSRALCQPP